MRLIFTLGAVFAIAGMNAQSMSESVARQAAMDFVMTHGDVAVRQRAAASGSVGMKNVLQRVEDTGNASVYVYNVAADGGFVMVAGDDASPSIVGYSDKGRFDSSNLPPQLKGILKQGGAVKSTMAVASASDSKDADELCYLTAEWGQGYPYNLMCPEIEGVRTQAGCVATAMAIAMQYHQWPDYTRGGVQTDYYQKELTFDFSDYVIDWSKLADKENPGFNAEVSKLMYSAGVASPMIYGVEESATEVWPIGHRLMELYTYGKDCQYVDREFFDDAAWNAMLRRQLKEVGPVIYRGGENDGHCFVIDGYDKEGRYHVNWGWDGMLNGYYALDFSDIGGLDFGRNQGMIINMAPDRERKQYSKSFIPNGNVYIAGLYGCDDWNFMKPDIVPGEEITLRIPTFTFNNHLGYYSLGVVDANDNIIKVITGPAEALDGSPTNCPYPGTDPYWKVTLPALETGQRYQFISQEADIDWDDRMALLSENPADWRIVLGGIVKPSYFYDKGNRSEISVVRYHFDEGIPFHCSYYNSQDPEMVVYRLKGTDCPADLNLPPGKIGFEVKCTDKNGNPKEPLYVMDVPQEELGYCNRGISTNISMYEDVYDVYVHYEHGSNTRHDYGVAAGEIHEADGLVYRLTEEGPVLIGYDNPGEEVVIPKTLSIAGKEMPLARIERGALAFAPIKSLISESPVMPDHAFSGMALLTDFTVSTSDELNVWPTSMIKTFVKNVYLENAVPTTDFLYASMNFHPYTWAYSFDNYVLGNDGVNFYFNSLEQFGALWNLYERKEYWNLEKVYDSYNIPGGIDLTWIDLPIREMWKYEIDKSNGYVKVSQPLENVRITGVSINGEESTDLGDGLYAIPGNDYSSFAVKVEYTVNGKKNWSTVYDEAFNAAYASTELGTTGLEIVELPQEDVKAVYNLQGILINPAATAADIDALPAGLYIIAGKKVRK